MNEQIFDKAFPTLSELQRSMYDLQGTHAGLTITVRVFIDRRSGLQLPALVMDRASSQGKNLRWAATMASHSADEPSAAVACMRQGVRIRNGGADMLDELGLRGAVILPYVDPASYLTNEEWMADPTFENYAVGWQRPLTGTQPAWGFPISYKDFHFSRTQCPPGTLIMMDVIDEFKPSSVFEPHASTPVIPGAFGAIDRWRQEVFDGLERSAEARGVRLYGGPPEAPWITVYPQSNGVLTKPYNLSSRYDYLEADHQQRPDETHPPATLIKCGDSIGGYLMGNVPGSAHLLLEATVLPPEIDPRRMPATLHDAQRQFQEELRHAFDRGCSPDHQGDGRRTATAAVDLDRSAASGSRLQDHIWAARAVGPQLWRDSRAFHRGNR